MKRKKLFFCVDPAGDTISAWKFYDLKTAKEEASQFSWEYHGVDPDIVEVEVVNHYTKDKTWKKV